MKLKPYDKTKGFPSLVTFPGMEPEQVNKDEAIAALHACALGREPVTIQHISDGPSGKITLNFEDPTEKQLNTYLALKKRLDDIIGVSNRAVRLTEELFCCHADVKSWALPLPPTRHDWEGQYSEEASLVIGETYLITPEFSGSGFSRTKVLWHLTHLEHDDGPALSAFDLREIFKRILEWEAATLIAKAFE